MEDKDIKTSPLDVGTLEGKLLISTPYLNGSCFEKTLIFICAHDDEGALGVIINQREGSISSDELYELLDMKKSLRQPKKYQVHFGGPVEDEKFFVLSASKEQKQNFNKHQHLTLFTNAEGFLADVVRGKQKDDFLLIKGFCGWAPNQLEEEIKENSWILSDVDYKTVFSKKSANSWGKLVKKLGIKNFDSVVSYTGNA